MSTARIARSALRSGIGRRGEHLYPVFPFPSFTGLTDRDIADLDAKFTEATSHEPVFPRTCSTYVTVSGAVPIVPGSGTGAYRGIAGTFAMTLTLNEVHDRPCTTSQTLLRQVIVLSGAGKITKD